MCLLPVFAALVAGICLVVVFAVEVQPSAPPRDGYILSFDRFKDHYKTGEKLDFTLATGGFGITCGTPNVDIIDKSGTTLYTLANHGTFTCTAICAILDQTWSLKDLDAENLTLLKAGDYEVVGSYHGAEVTKDIQVS